MQNFKNFEMNFRPLFDACISCNIQPINLILKILVDLDFNDRLYSFLHWGCRIGVVLSHHLARSKHRVKRFLDLVTSQYRLFPRRRKNLYKKLLRRFGKGDGRRETNLGGLTEFRQPLQVQSHLEMPGILVQLGHTQRT